MCRKCSDTFKQNKSALHKTLFRHLQSCSPNDIYIIVVSNNTDQHSTDIPSGDHGCQTWCNRIKMQNVGIKNTFRKLTLLTFKPSTDGCQIKPLIIMSGVLDRELVSSNPPTCCHTRFTFCLKLNERNREREGEGRAKPG